MMATSSPFPPNESSNSSSAAQIEYCPYFLSFLTHCRTPPKAGPASSGAGAFWPPCAPTQQYAVLSARPPCRRRARLTVFFPSAALFASATILPASACAPEVISCALSLAPARFFLQFSLRPLPYPPVLLVNYPRLHPNLRAGYQIP